MKLNVTELHEPVLFVVDMINGFAREGALADPAIAGIAPKIIQLIETLPGEPVFITDEHDADAREFEAFPVHCLKGTEESAVIDELQPYVRRRIGKNSTCTFVAPEFQRFLQENGDRFTDWILAGCCTDICILQFALALQAYFNEHGSNNRVIVPADCTATYHMDDVHNAAQWQKMALDIMAASGVLVCDGIEAAPAEGKRD